MLKSATKNQNRQTMGKQNKVTKSTSQETIDLGLSSPKKDRTDEILALITQSNANNNKRFDDLYQHQNNTQMTAIVLQIIKI